MALNSKTTLKIIDVLSEGPIEGLVPYRESPSKQSVYLNETIITGKQYNDKSVRYLTKLGTGTQGTFNEGSTFNDQQTTIIDVNRQIGSSYSETLSTTKTNTVDKRDYGVGQVTQAIAQTDIDFVELVFTIPKLFCIAEEGLARGQLFFAQIKLELHICGTDGAWNEVDIEVENQQKKNIIKGICTSSYQFKTQTIDLTHQKYGKGPYKIRVRKVSFKIPGDDTTSKEDAFEISFRDFRDVPKATPIASKRADQIFLTSIIVGKKFGTAYPYTALVSLSLDADEYTSLPARAYEVKGLKVQIPSNATVRGDDQTAPGSLEFDDSIPFDGSLKEDELHWTTCPVCCFYNLLTNKRYGAGDFINESNLNWVDLIELARYSNEIVTNPDGTEEARFAINTIIGSQAEAYSVLQDMASVFRGMLFWKSDNVQIAADHGELRDNVESVPKDVPAIHVFSNSNVTNGAFAYSGSSLKTRSTRVRVRYNDPDNFYKPNFICIEDLELIRKYGVQEKSVVAFGCTSKYQAQRMGRWIMQSERLHDETISFSVGLEGLNVLPGQVFEVSDEMRLAIRLSGRIVGVDNESSPPFVRIDQDAFLPSPTGNKLTVVMKDGNIETRDIINISGNEIRLTDSFKQVPPIDAIYAVKSGDAINPKYRCLSVAEGDDGRYTIVGIKHVDGIYRVVEGRAPFLDEPAPYIYGADRSPATDPQIMFQEVNDGRNTINRATISWTRGLSGSVIEFEVQYKVGEGGNWITRTTNNTAIDITTGLIPGKKLIAKITAIGPAPDYARSDITNVEREIPATATSDASGGITFDPDTNRSPNGIMRVRSVLLPPDPESVDIEVIGVDQVLLSWSSTANGQNLEAFVAVIRHSSKTDGTPSWTDSVILRTVEARTTAAVLPLLNGEYLIKFQNEAGLRSANAVRADVNVPDPIPRLNYEIFREDANYGAFPGQANNVYYNDDYKALVLSGDGDFDLIPNVDSMDSFDFLGEQVLSGEYFFSNVVDLGGIYSVRMQRILSEQGLYLSDLIDDRTENIDIWSDFDGEIADDTNARVYFRKSNDTESFGDIVQEDGLKIEYEDESDIRQESDLEFGNWMPLENNAFVGRSFQFKAVLTTDHNDQTPAVDELGVIFQLERRTENSIIMNSGFGTRNVFFEDAFYVDNNTSVAVSITALDMEPEDYFVMTEPTAIGFEITFKGTFDGNELINRRFSYTAVGYGKREAP